MRTIDVGKLDHQERRNLAAWMRENARSKGFHRRNETDMDPQEAELEAYCRRLEELEPYHGVLTLSEEEA